MQHNHNNHTHTRQPTTPWAPEIGRCVVGACHQLPWKAGGCLCALGGCWVAHWQEGGQALGGWAVVPQPAARHTLAENRHTDIGNTTASPVVQEGRPAEVLDQALMPQPAATHTSAGQTRRHWQHICFTCCADFCCLRGESGCGTRGGFCFRFLPGFAFGAITLQHLYKSSKFMSYLEAEATQLQLSFSPIAATHTSKQGHTHGSNQCSSSTRCSHNASFLGNCLWSTCHPCREPEHGAWSALAP